MVFVLDFGSVRFRFGIWVVGSVGFSVGSSIWNLGWAYISSLFPGIKNMF